MMVLNNASSRSGLRVLVVEDEFLVAEHISFTLENLGYEVVGPVPTVDAAIALIGSEAPDCALLDANLGGKSSAPIAAELVARSIPFVVVTGYGHFKLATAALEAAPRISKPFSTDDLAAKLARALTR
jgi:CheY-like chemotaxis protein